MKGASKVIMGATLAMVVTLAIVLGLILVLLADLYCTLLLRRRRRQQLHANSSNGVTPTAPVLQTHSGAPVRSNAPGVVPRSHFYPDKGSQQLHHFLHPTPPHQTGEIQIQVNATNEEAEPLPEPAIVYISNPIFDNRAVETPFETPDSSPSRLETGGGGGGGSSEIDRCHCKECSSGSGEESSVSLKEARSLGTHSVTNNGFFSSSSSSGSPCVSPSW